MTVRSIANTTLVVMSFAAAALSCTPPAGPAASPPSLGVPPPVAPVSSAPVTRAPVSGAPAPAVALGPVHPEEAPVEMTPPVPTGLVAELQSLGLTAQSLPPIEKLDPKALRGVMKLMAKSLGVKCAGCHDSDFAAPTRRKKIAARMWDEFAVKLAMDGGAPIFCDSCHQGRTVLLDRRDKKALGAWMNENLVTKLERKDGQSHECETCHVDMDMKFLTRWGAL